MMKSDSQLQRDVTEEIRWDPSIGRAEIGITARDGVVTLSGQVDTYAKKLAAVRAAERVAGVKAVAEEMTVALPLPFERTDTDIAHAAVNAMRWDIEVPDETVKVRVENGWVWLEGEVNWQFQRTSAERAVRYLTGVKGVTNLIKIAAHASIPDVERRIDSALKRQAELDAKRIRVDAANGKVTLSGTVRSWTEREAAERAAWSAEGVTAVEDRLDVKL